MKIKEIKICPFGCVGNKVIFKFEKRTHIIKDKLINGLVGIYECEECHEKFTTTESDIESFKTFKK